MVIMWRALTDHTNKYQTTATLDTEYVIVELPLRQNCEHWTNL